MHVMIFQEPKLRILLEDLSEEGRNLKRGMLKVPDRTAEYRISNVEFFLIFECFKKLKKERGLP